MVVTISRADLQSMREAAAASPDAEVCGLLLGTAQNGHFTVQALKPARNTAPDISRHFEIDPATLIEAHRNARAGNPAIIGHYHSHPNGAPAPSAIDLNDAPPGQILALIIAHGAVHAWAMEEGRAHPVALNSV